MGVRDRYNPGLGPEMFVLLDVLGAVGGAALVFSAVLGLGAGLGAVREVPATRRPAPAASSGLAQALAAALERAVPLAAASGVALSLATEPGFAPRVNAPVLDAALDSLLAAAVRAAPSGKVLVTARRRGGTVMIAVADDGAVFDAETRRAALRATEQAVALQGGRLELSGLAGEGGTVRLLLPVPVGVRPARAAVPVAEAAQAAPRAVSATVG